MFILFLICTVYITSVLRIGLSQYYDNMTNRLTIDADIINGEIALEYTLLLSAISTIISSGNNTIFEDVL